MPSSTTAPPSTPSAPFFPELLDDILQSSRQALASSPFVEQHVAFVCKQISRIAAPCVAAELQRQLVQAVRSAATLPTVRDLDLFAAYPLLQSKLQEVARALDNAALLLHARLQNDRALLTTTFRLAVTDTVEDCAFGLSDPHQGHHAVSILTFHSGLKVVYKPRPGRLDVAFASLAAWINSYLEDTAILSAVVLDCDSYSWSEYVPQSPVRDPEQYYRSAGALAALGYFLCAEDLHGGNLVATASGPVPVDLECLLAQGTHAFLGQDDVPADVCPAQHSVLSTGLLPYWISGDPNSLLAVDSGLTGPGARPPVLKRRIWLDADTVAFRAAWSTTSPEQRHNLPANEQGAPLRPETFLGPLQQGFEVVYRFVLANRDLFLDSIRSHFTAPSRHLLRDTYRYHRLLDRLADPESFASEADFAERLKTLHRETFAAVEPALEEEERKALCKFDIPIFNAHPNARGVVLSDGATVNLFDRSPAEQVRDRILMASPEDLRRQRSLLQVSLRMESEPPVSLPSESGQWIDAALVIADSIAHHALEGSIGTSWMTVARPPTGEHSAMYLSLGHDLYNGSSGIALFLANLYATMGGEHWKHLAVDALRYSTTVESLLAPNPCAFAGSLSVVYALVECARLLAQPYLLDQAAAIAARLKPESTPAKDLLLGDAGSILALLHLHHATGEAIHLSVAETLAAPLNVESPLPPGLGHGASGVALALARLADTSGNDRYAHSAHSIVHAERAQMASWSQNICGWCAGAAGIGLSRTALLNSASMMTYRAELMTDLEHTVTITRARLGQPSDHLCCGESSRILLLSAAAKPLREPLIAEEAEQCFSAMLQRTNRRGHWMLQSGADRTGSPSLMGGSAGIGYTALALAFPDGVSRPLILG